MSQRNASADLPLASVQRGISVGALALGLLSLIAVLANASEPVGPLAGVAFFALFWGSFMWLATRGRSEFHRVNLTHVAGPGRRGPRPAFRRGALMAVVLTVVETLVIALFERLWAGPSIEMLLPGILLGSALWMTLDTRDLRRWQESNALVVFTRTGASLIALTRKQSQRQHVLIPIDPAAAP